MNPNEGYAVKYRSHRALDADHAAYLIHGGMVVPLPDDHPELNTMVTIRLESPQGEAFHFQARVGRSLPGRGFMVSFESSHEAQAELDAMVGRDAFRKAVDTEDPHASQPPLVSKFTRETEDEAPDDALGFSEQEHTDELVGAMPWLDDEASDDRPDAPSDDNLDDATDPMPKLHPDVIAAAQAEAEPDPPQDDEDGPALHPDLEALMDDAPGATDAPDPKSDPPADAEAAEERPVQTGKTELRRPGPGEKYWVYVLKYSTIREFQERAREFEATCLIRVPDEEEALPKINDAAQVRITLPGHNVFTMWSVVERLYHEAVELRVDKNDENFRKAILHPTTIAARKRLNREASSDTPRVPVQVLRITQDMPEEDVAKMPIRRRLARMSMDDKINLALSGNREERMALAMDSNKAIHHYLLKNAKITLDEIAFMARLPSMNPDVLDKIAENPAYTQNPGVTKALVYNPRTPLKTSIRLLDRLPRSELMNLSKRMSMNQRLVMAAKNKILKYRP